MRTIIPAIIPKDTHHLTHSLEMVRSFAREVQVDIVDGVFVPFTSWPYNSKGVVIELHKFTPDFEIEMDLMIQTPETVLEQYLIAGVRKVVIHLESTDAIQHIRTLCHAHDCAVGFSINNDTPLERLLHVIELCDYVQCMGIERIGAQGLPFDERVLTRVQELKKRFPHLQVSVDGGVNADTISRLAKVGVDRFISGSAIFAAQDPKVAYDSLLTAANQKSK